MVYLRNKQLTFAFKVLKHCPNLIVVDLANNMIGKDSNDLIEIYNFKYLRKLSLNNNMLNYLPEDKIFSQLISLEIINLHENNISSWI